MRSAPREGASASEKSSLAGAAEIERTAPASGPDPQWPSSAVTANESARSPLASSRPPMARHCLLYDSEQTVIADIRTWRTTGWTLERIADEMTHRAVPTKTAKSKRLTHQAVAPIARCANRVRYQYRAPLTPNEIKVQSSAAPAESHKSIQDTLGSEPNLPLSLRPRESVPPAKNGS